MICYNNTEPTCVGQYLKGVLDMAEPKLLCEVFTTDERLKRNISECIIILGYEPIVGPNKVMTIVEKGNISVVNLCRQFPKSSISVLA